jgi:hypothetical protein
MSTYEETVRCCTTGRGSQLCIADKKHDELKSFGRFWYQEIRDFLNSERKVPMPSGFVLLGAPQGATLLYNFRLQSFS